jgi:DNA-binding transcriptional LysR family regulator
MTIRNISGERFTLLATFKAIYENGNISSAAEVQGITQSAVSKHLQKLREWFRDELFVRAMGRMEPTEIAVSLIERVEHILKEVAIISQASHFDPTLLRGVFTIATTSEVSQRLTPGLLKKLSEVSPQLRITVINLANDYSIRELELGKVDLVISVNWHAPEQLIQKRLYNDRFVCLMHKNHPLAKQKLTIDAYANAMHIMVAPLGKERGFIDEQLAQRGLRRQVRLSVPDFSQLEAHLLDGEHIVTLPHRVALDLRKKGELMIKQLPFEAPGFDYYMFWHRRFSNQNASRWVREIVSDLLAELYL